MRRASVFSYPVVIKREMGVLMVQAPDFGLFVAVDFPTENGFSIKMAAQVAHAYVKLIRKMNTAMKAKQDSHIPLPKPSTTREIFNFEADSEISFSPVEAAKIIRVSKNTIRRALDRGLIKCMKTPGGHRRLTRSQVIELRALLCRGPVDGLDIGVSQRDIESL